MNAALIVLSLLSAAPGSSTTADASCVVASPDFSEPLHWIGVSLDAGVPDGVGVAANFRPWRWVRISVAGLTNGFAPGIRGGLTFVPFDWTVAPSLTVEAGRFLPGNANPVVARFVGDSSYHSGFLDRVDYGFGNAQLGLEMGKPNRWQIYLHGGYSHLIGNVESFSQGLSDQAGEPMTSTPLHTELTFPSAKLGFVYFLG